MTVVSSWKNARTSWKEYVGLSTDTKPTAGIPLASRFLETDSGTEYVWNGSAWVAIAGLRVEAEPFLYSIAQGHLSGKSGVLVVGSSITSGTNEETIWDGNSIYTYITAATKVKISSSSTDDDEGGTGALTVLVKGLDSNYAEISETITLDGRDGVETTETYLRVFSLEVQTAGSGGSNAGDIYAGTGTITTGVPVNKYCKILVEHNRSLSGLWTVPADKTFYMTSIFMAEASRKVTDFHVYQRLLGGVFHLDYHLQLSEATISIPLDVPTVFPEKADIEARVNSDASGAHCTMVMSGWYET